MRFLLHCALLDHNIIQRSHQLLFLYFECELDCDRLATTHSPWIFTHTIPFSNFELQSLTAMARPTIESIGSSRQSLSNNKKVEIFKKDFVAGAQQNVKKLFEKIKSWMNAHLENQHTLNIDINEFIKEHELKIKQIGELIEKHDTYKNACARAMLDHNNMCHLFFFLPHFTFFLLWFWWYYYYWKD
jgi:hypothetical protein